MRQLFWIAILGFLLLTSFDVCRSSAQGGSPADGTNVQITEVKSDPFTPRIPPRALEYHRVNRTLLFIGIAWRFAGFWLILKLKLLVRVRQWTENRQAQRALNTGGVASNSSPLVPGLVLIASCFAVYSLFTLVWNLPVGLAGLATEWRFGFSHLSLLNYFKDVLTNFCINFGAYTFLLYPGFWLVAKFPRKWWAFVWSMLVPLSFLTAVIYPIAISPLFNRYDRLPEGILREKILTLANRAGLQGAEIFVENTSSRTSHVNAYVIGIGPTTRIVLNDTAIKELPEDQLLAMMGHEMGHYAEKHIWIGLATGAFGSFFLLWLLSRMLAGLQLWKGKQWGIESLTDPAALPMLFLCVYFLTLAGEPPGTAVSRELEHRADAYGLRLTHLNDASAKLFVGFAERDLSDPDPPLWLHLWFGTHPTLKERIDFARNFRE